MQDAAPNSLVAPVKEVTPLLKAHSSTVYAHLLSTLNQTDPLGFSQALSQCRLTSDWLKKHAQFIPREPGESVGTPPTHIPDDPTDLITSKQGYSRRKLAHNHNAKNLIELRIMYMRTPALYPEDEVDLRAQGAPGTGAWLAVPASNTTINDGVVQQDPQAEVGGGVQGVSGGSAAPRGHTVTPPPHSPWSTEGGSPAVTQSPSRLHQGRALQRETQRHERRD